MFCSDHVLSIKVENKLVEVDRQKRKEQEEEYRRKMKEQDDKYRQKMKEQKVEYRRKMKEQDEEYRHKMSEEQNGGWHEHEMLNEVEMKLMNMTVQAV